MPGCSYLLNVNLFYIICYVERNAHDLDVLELKERQPMNWCWGNILMKDIDQFKVCSGCFTHMDAASCLPLAPS